MKDSLKQNQISTMNDRKKIEDTLLMIKKAMDKDDKTMLKILNNQLYSQINKYINNAGRV